MKTTLNGTKTTTEGQNNFMGEHGPQPEIQPAEIKASEEIVQQPEQVKLAKEEFILELKKARPKIENYCRALTRRNNNSESDAQDLFQDVMVRALKSWHTFRGEADLHDWLIRISRNEFFSKYKKEKSNVISNANTADINSENVVDRATENFSEKLENKELVDKLLKNVKLDAVSQNIIQLHYFNGLTVEEVAHELSMNENTVKIKLLRAREKLFKVYKRLSARVLSKKNKGSPQQS